MEKTKELGTKPIGKLIAQYSIPAVIAMLVNAVYNVVDRIFIGNFTGEEALAGLTIAFPIMMITFAFATLVGAGGSALMSIRLGEKNNRGASHVFGNTIAAGFLITAAILIVLFFNIHRILNIFGATPEILEFAASYMRIILMGFIFQLFSFILNNSVRVEGQPLLPMAAMMLSAIINIILDYIFIVNLGQGVEGAALATIIGQFSGFLLLLSFYFRGKSQLRLKLSDFKPDWTVLKPIFSIGVATFVGTLGTSMALSFMNRQLAIYGGSAAITSMGAINSLFTFFIMPIMGIQQGLQPIIGYNYGARAINRVYDVLKKGIGTTVVFSTVVFIFLQAFPETFIGLFLGSDSPTVSIAVPGLRTFILMLPIVSINIVGVAFFQSTARGRISMFLSLSRQFLFLIPLVMILPHFFGLNGVWAATPIADALSVLITLFMLVGDYKKNNVIEGVSHVSESAG